MRIASLVAAAAVVVPFSLAPAPVAMAGEMCPALCQNQPPLSLTAEHDASDECERISRERDYPCHAPHARGPISHGHWSPARRLERTERRVPDADFYGLY